MEDPGLERGRPLPEQPELLADVGHLERGRVHAYSSSAKSPDSSKNRRHVYRRNTTDAVSTMASTPANHARLTPGRTGCSLPTGQMTAYRARWNPMAIDASGFAWYRPHRLTPRIFLLASTYLTRLAWSITVRAPPVRESENRFHARSPDSR